MQKELIMQDQKSIDKSSEVLDIITDKPEVVEAPSLGPEGQYIVTSIPQDLSSLFFEQPLRTPEGVHQVILLKPAGQMVQMGLYPENIKIGLLAIMVSLSARLGYPLTALLVSENPLEAVRIINAVAKLAPEDCILELDSIKPDVLFIQGGRHYRGRCIICTDPTGFLKVSQYIESILSRGIAIYQEFVKRRFDSEIDACRAEWPISFIALENGKQGKGLLHPSILRVPVTPQRFLPEVSQKAQMADIDLSQSPLFKIRKTFDRLKARPVRIPYEDMLWSAMEVSRCEYPDIKMSVLINLISICAIINNPPPLTISELGSYIYGTDEEEVSRALIDNGQHEQAKVAGAIQNEAIIATKIDYYLARLLLDGLLSTGGPYLSDRQKRVFKTVKAINLGKMGNAIVKDDDIEKLATIARSSGYWATREKVFEIINKRGEEYYSLSSVSNDLVALYEMGILDRAKPPKSRAFGYYIMGMNLDDAIRLPEPAEIQDPTYQGREISVVNPITGQVEKI